MGAGKKSDKRRRSWSQCEEEVLITAWKDLVANVWKANNGFRIGYLQLLEQSMANTFLSTDLHAIPHINSKIHVWKKNYSSIFTTLSRGSIGWNESTKMIEVTDDAWESYVKTDLNARLMRFKSWPCYNDWCEIFGKDRATGVNAQDFVEALNDILNGDAQKINQTTEEFNDHLQEFVEDTESICASEIGGSASKKKKGNRKKKLKEGEDQIYEMLGTFCEKTDTRLGNIARRIGHKFDISQKHKEVCTTVGKVEGLNLQEKLQVSKFLIKNTKELELFFSLPDEAKGEFACMILAGS
ncbi:hypothetical protein CDL12_04655 [Handroanthus impetiginosus]|uniref:Myb/SANT-like domain-containing protein n=1 Tax=Handroanthus impetiginosus TaxID=429701 RepID=A0A2G9HYQ5_9LAMI|nr:hypothetical protein CDL12_04655 [Handroanthus impetiginosus]